VRDENTLYWLWLAEKCGIASKQFGRLIEKYDDPFDVYRLSEDEIEQLEGINGALRAKLCEKDLESSYSILKYCKENRVDIISYGDSRYPARLKNIEDAPILLYCLGHFPDFNSALCIGIVGTRKMSEYGKQSAYKIGYELSSAGAIVVSGMALGVDGAAASGALSAGGRTVAVLGCGISVVYPKEHKKLMEEISRKGAVITEYPPTEAPHGHNFPKRNRIISGLCQGVLVVEGAAGSGALITARRAIDQGREVFALPGKIDESNSEGPNELIQSGAHMAMHAEDILNFYDFLYHDVVDYKGLSRAKKQVHAPSRTLKKYGVAARALRIAPVATAPAEEASAPVSPKRTQKPKKKTEEAPAESVKTQNPTPTSPDRSQEILVSLDDTTRKVLEAMPLDRSVSPDALVATGLDMGDVMTSLTMLELGGFVSSLPGGLYTRT
jgi:DNA processing protein